MGTQGVTTAVLAAHLGNPPQYGETAADVLGTCSLIAAAEDQWEQKEIRRFQEQVGIHEKVWGRLLAIHRCTRWQEVDQSDLPGNYTALYALTTVSDEAWAQLLERKMLSRSLSSRKILDWQSVVQTGTVEFSTYVQMVLACHEDRDDDVQNVIDMISKIAKEHDMYLIMKRTSLPGFTFGASPEQKVKSIGGQLISLLTPVLADAGKVLKDTLSIQTEEDLINASMRDFLKFINRTAGSSAAALETYGKEYCLKLALEYNRMSNTRANRFNYKKKLEELAEHRENEALRDCARTVFRDFIGEVRGE